MSDMIPLSAIAHGRSGDKGNHANIAIIAYTQAGYDWVREWLTADVVARCFASMMPSRVVRFEAPNVLGLNFLLNDILAGGMLSGIAVRIDTQGTLDAGRL